MSKFEERFKKEAECFDLISTERKSNNQIPDLRVEFVNEYFYNNIWRNSKFLQAEYGPLVKWIIDSLKSIDCSSVVELGSGNGFLSLELAREGFNVTGLDLSEDSINIAQTYLNSLSEKDELSLKYVCKNVMDYKEYSGESIVCFGFLHHLPPEVLEEIMSYFWEKMNPGQVLLVVEPRYDYANYEMSALTYALQLSMPNHFKYKNIQDNASNHINDIFDELAENHHEQSELDNESPSGVILKIIKNQFKKVETKYSTAFFDKVIGSIRVDEQDTAELTDLLKRIDEIIIKYNKNFARAILIKAVKE